MGRNTLRANTLRANTLRANTRSGAVPNRPRQLKPGAQTRCARARKLNGLAPERIGYASPSHKYGTRGNLSGSAEDALRRLHEVKGTLRRLYVEEM